MYRVTQDIFVGRFASRQRLIELRDRHVTDILNVSDAPSQLVVDDGPFRSVNWIEIVDRKRIPTDKAIAALDTIHAALSIGAGRIYIHCTAGWNRSPTVIWLYLIACGVDPEAAKRLVCANAFDAVPGHALLVDPDLITAVCSHGRHSYEPHPRPDALAAPEVTEQSPARKDSI